MPTYVPIADNEIDGESPVTVSLMTRLRDNALSYLGAPSGTKLLFPQSSAPLGWTKDVTHHDKAIRLTTGVDGGSSGGTLGFSTVFSRTASDGHSLAASEIPPLTTGNQSANHDHNIDTPSGKVTILNGTGAAQTQVWVGTSPGTTGTQNQAHVHSTAGTGNAHTHDMDIRVQYVNSIIGTKD